MRFHGRFLALLAAVLMLATAPEAGANTWTVGRAQADCPGGCNFYDLLLGSNAGEGIKIAMESPSVVSGDTVLVWRGTRDTLGVKDYPGRITMKSGVKLIAFGYPDSVPVISSTAGQVAAITMVGCSEVTEVNGFIITWDSGTLGLGGGIAAYTSGGIIKNNRFVNCVAGIGAGVHMQACTMNVTNNLFLNNVCNSGGGVISVSAGTPVIENNSIVGATAPLGAEGAGIYVSGADPTIRNNIIYGSKGASAVFCGGGNMPTFECNMFYANQVGAFGGQCTDSTGTSGNVIADPLFCSPSMQQYGLCSDSPALAGGACGTVGYVSPFGGCAACRPTPVAANLQASSWGMVKALYR
ncbi:MAG TPA: right-handed parallel beta-helix repeat-containing protein [bacterium]|nr:right-handed parallel beta-helix repeat-containing protein [bacterium]